MTTKTTTADPAPALTPIGDAGERAGALLDADRLQCSVCRLRAAWCIRGPYGDVALCKECDGEAPASTTARNYGEVWGAGMTTYRCTECGSVWDSRWEDFEEWCEDEANSGSYLRGAYGDTGTGHSPEDWVADLVKAAKLAQKALEMRRRWEVGPSHRVRRWREAGLPVSLSETDTVNAELAALEALRGLVQ